MEQKALIYAQKHNMLSHGDKIVVAVSGGADSMCLLCLLLRWRKEFDLKLKVVHINHGIRGESADRDENFVREFCSSQGVEFECVRGDIPEIAAQQGLTEEEAGRNFRYEQFVRICKEQGFGSIAVAHNSDDNAETVLFNIIRGSGVSGIRGIAPISTRSGIRIIRPLLSSSRADIEEYLRKLQVGYCTDETNLTVEYSRNKIRNLILPRIKAEINPAAARHINELSVQAGELENLVEELTSGTIKELKERSAVKYGERNSAVCEIEADVRELIGLNCVIRKSIIRKFLGQLAGSLKDIESRHVEKLEELLGLGVGRRINLPYGITALRKYNTVLLTRNAENMVSDARADCENSIVLTQIQNEEGFTVPKKEYTKYFDYDKIKGEVRVRTRETGDYLLIRVNGTLHRKSLKTWFVDNKIPSDLRDGIPLLTEGQHVLWIAGYRRDDSYPVTGGTKTILVAEYRNADKSIQEARNE